MQSFKDYYYDSTVENIFEARRSRSRKKEADPDVEIAELEGRLSELLYHADPQGQLGKTPADKLDNFLDVVNLTLDTVGFIPGFEIADLINMAIYASRGKWGDAAISGISAIPMMDLVKLLKVRKGTKSAKLALKLYKPIYKSLKAKGTLKVMPKVVSGVTKAAKGLKLGRGIYNSKIFLNKYFKKYLGALDSLIPYAKFARGAGDVQDITDIGDIGALSRLDR